MFCPKCKAEYVKGVTICKDCNVPLVEELPDDESETREDNDNQAMHFEEVWLTYNMAEIALIKSLLESAGIDYYFMGEHYRVVQQFADPARLMVRKDQAEAARDLLKDLDFRFFRLQEDGETKES